MGTYNKIYSSLWVKYSPNFYGHSSETNKLGFVYMNGGADAGFFLSTEGSGTGPLYLAARFQDGNNGPGSLPVRICPGNNIFWSGGGCGGSDASGIFTRGVWHHIEYLADTVAGTYDMWLDGTQIAHVTGLNYYATFSGYAQWPYPIWGGRTNTVPEAMWSEWEDFYLSGST
jgi:hypothetical protein